MAKGPVDPVPLKAMGRFTHEAAVVDPKTGIVYMTEDMDTGLFYRFVPKQPGRLRAGGTLEALRIPSMPKAYTGKDFPLNTPMAVDWVTIEDFDPVDDTVRVEGFDKGAAIFAGGEGACFAKGEVFFSASNGGSAELGQIWRHTPGRNAAEGGTLELFVEPNDDALLDGPDNIVLAPFGDLFVCEDGEGTEFVRGITPEGKLYSFARNALNGFEFTGASFSPDGKTFFVNI